MAQGGMITRTYESINGVDFSNEGRNVSPVSYTHLEGKQRGVLKQDKPLQHPERIHKECGGERESG